MKKRMTRLACLWLAVILLVGTLVMPASAVNRIPGFCYFANEDVDAGDNLNSIDCWFIISSIPYGADAPTIDEFLESIGITDDTLERDGEAPIAWRIWTYTQNGIVQNSYFEIDRNKAITQKLYNDHAGFGWDTPCIEPLYARSDASTSIYEDLGGILCADEDYEINFTDVAKTSPYYDAVVNAASKGWMKGVSPTQFAPDASLTRAMIWTILARADGCRTDGDGQWYGIGRQWVMRNGISDGTNPDATLTQEELITMVWRSVASPYCVADVTNENVSDWAMEAVRWALANNIISCNFDPKAAATRAWTAQIMMLA